MDRFQSRSFEIEGIKDSISTRPRRSRGMKKKKTSSAKTHLIRLIKDMSGKRVARCNLRHFLLISTAFSPFDPSTCSITRLLTTSLRCPPLIKDAWAVPFTPFTPSVTEPSSSRHFIHRGGPPPHSYDTSFQLVPLIPLVSTIHCASLASLFIPLPPLFFSPLFSFSWK